MSILSSEPDGLGFHYGFVAGDRRQINVRREGSAWIAYVDGEPIAGSFNTKEAAETSAVAFVGDNPEPLSE